MAGYSVGHAAEIKRKLLKHECVVSALEIINTAKLRSAIAGIEERKRILTDIARGKLRDYETGELIEGVTVTGRERAMEELNRMDGIGRSDAGVQVGVAIQISSNVPEPEGVPEGMEAPEPEEPVDKGPDEGSGSEGAEPEEDTEGE